MAQVLAARVTCPTCGNQYQAHVEQILDVREDPSAKIRVLNRVVNAVVCPHCKARGALSMPFLYHDPDKELALVYMPMEAGHDNLQRQRAIGRFTSAAMGRLPPEERKAYLLQPQVFLTLDNLVNKVLEADGVTPEMIEEQKAKAALLERMLGASSDEVLEAIIRENDASIDVDLFRLLAMNLEIAEAGADTIGAQRLRALRGRLLEVSSEGKTVQARGKALEALQAAPTRQNLLDLLSQASNEETRRMLVTLGRRLLDYRFFQNLTSQIDTSSNEREQERLTELRREILAIRDQLDEEARALYEARSELLRDLLLSDDPERLARRRFWELDGAFLDVLRTNLEQARTADQAEAVDALLAISGLVAQLAEESSPPELRLLDHLMGAEDDADIEQILEANRDLVTERMVQVIETAEIDLREGGESEAAERMALILQKAQAMVAA